MMIMGGDACFTQFGAFVGNYSKVICDAPAMFGNLVWSGSVGSLFSPQIIFVRMAEHGRYWFDWHHRTQSSLPESFHALSVPVLPDTRSKLNTREPFIRMTSEWRVLKMPDLSKVCIKRSIVPAYLRNEVARRNLRNTDQLIWCPGFIGCATRR